MLRAALAEPSARCLLWRAKGLLSCRRDRSFALRAFLPPPALGNKATSLPGPHLACLLVSLPHRTIPRTSHPHMPHLPSSYALPPHAATTPAGSTPFPLPGALVGAQARLPDLPDAHVSVAGETWS